VNVLADKDRRLLAHLAIPRNVSDLEHQMRVDAGAPTLPGAEVASALEEFERSGLVVKLDGYGGPARLASRAQASDAIPLHDESAAIFARRRSDPRMAWQVTGDTYMLANAGLERLREPTVEDRALTTAELKELVALQGQCVLDADGLKAAGAKFAGSIHEQGEYPGDPAAGGILLDAETGKPFEGDAGPSLGASAVTWRNPHSGQIVPLGTMLEEEYLRWVRAVLEDHEGRWGKGEAREVAKAAGPLLRGGSQFSDAYEIILLDAENQKASITAAAPWYMALSILALNDTDTGTTADDGSRIPTYTGYARKSVAAADMNAGSGTSGSVTNANAIIFAACTAGSSTIVAFAHCAAATVGVLRKYGTCSSTTVSTTQTPPQFAAAAYTTTIA
jgi:hypothetical protein